jgi:hypothetical protein
VAEGAGEQAAGARAGAVRRGRGGRRAGGGGGGGGGGGAVGSVMPQLVISIVRPLVTKMPRLPTPAWVPRAGPVHTRVLDVPFGSVWTSVTWVPTRRKL